MARVALVTVHGMGMTLGDYAEELRRSLAERLGRRFGEVAFEAVQYHGLLQPEQHALWRRTEAGAAVRQPAARKLMLFGMGAAAALENGKQQDGSLYELVQLEIASRMLAARDQIGADAPLVFIAHSLGCQLLSSYLYDAQKSLRGPVCAGIWRDIDRHGPAIAGHALSPGEKAFLQGATFRRWITTGCHMPIAMAAHRGMTALPIGRPTPDFEWVNFYDADDALGWPLQPVSPRYRELVEDRRIVVARAALDGGAEPWAAPLLDHAYWRSPEVLDRLQGMLLEFL